MTFTPYNVGSLADQHSQEVARRRISNQPYEQSVGLNNQYRAAEAQKAGDDLKALAGFSKKLGEIFVAKTKEKNIQEEAEGYADYQNRLANNALTAAEENDRETLANSDNELKGERSEHENLAFLSYKTDEDYSIVNELKELSGHRRLGYARAWLDDQAANHGSFILNGMMENDSIVLNIGGNNFTPKTADRSNALQMKAATDALNIEYLKRFNGINKALLAEKGGYYEKAINSLKTIQSTHRSNAFIRKSIDTREGLFKEAGTGLGEDDKPKLSFSTLLQGTANTLDSKGHLLDFSGAWEHLYSNLPEFIADGGLGEDQDKILNAWKEEVIPEGHPGAGRKYGDFHKAKFAKLESEILRTRNQRNSVDEQAEIADANRLEDKMIADLKPDIDKGTLFTVDDIEKVLTKFTEQTNGREATQLKKLLEANKALSPEMLSLQDSIAEEHLANNTLTPDYVKSLHPKIRSKYETALVRQGDIKYHNEARDKIEQKVKEIAKIGTGGDQRLAAGSKANSVYLELRDIYNIRFQTAVTPTADGGLGFTPAAAREYAMKEMETYYQANSQKPETKIVNEGTRIQTRVGVGDLEKSAGGRYFYGSRGFEFFNQSPKDDRKARVNEVKKLQTDAGGRELLLDKSGGIYTIEQLETISSKYKTYGGRFPDNVRRDAMTLDVTPLELINRQIKALGNNPDTNEPWLPEVVPITTGLEAIQSILFP